MASKADANRIQKLRALLYLSASEGWPTSELDAALSELYRNRRAPKTKG
jgi:hypothetical protein